RQERRLSQLHLGDPDDTVARADLDAQRRLTDAAQQRASETAPELRQDAAEDVRRGADALLTGDDRLARLRADIDSGDVERDDALIRYTSLIEDTDLLAASLLGGVHRDDTASQAVTAAELRSAREGFSHADALLSGAIAAGAMEYEETAQFTYLTASYRQTLDDTEPALRGDVLALFRETTGSGAWTGTEELSRSVVTRPPITGGDERGRGAGWNSEIGIDGAQWAEATQSAGAELDGVVTAQQQAALGAAHSSALQIIALGVTGCVLTLVAGIAAIVVATRSSRRLTGRLLRLRSDTLALADTRLPAIVARTQSGQRVNLADELPQLSFGEDEIGQVAAAFNAAQRTAVGAAVKQAEIRQGANRVFLGIAYRNQTLVQRQLHVLDEIEHEEDDPVTLRKLFRLDHLATRARRYADNLLILSGAHSARRWREALPLIDVVRAAITETEDYERVRLTSAPGVRVRGTAVADIVHLLAELVENATQFSPADTPVDVHCGPVAGGIAVDVEDRGLGMTEQGYAAAARILAGTPEFDVMALQEEPRLGLFVVARLAARHGVAVRLCPSPYGGTRAIAVIPEAMLDSGDQAAIGALRRRAGSPRRQRAGARAEEGVGR
ncbi:nitrate- and nitrite sensing domain-containing protein, partial [Nocardiopsis sediminis]